MAQDQGRFRLKLMDRWSVVADAPWRALLFVLQDTQGVDREAASRAIAILTS